MRTRLLTALALAALVLPARGQALPVPRGPSPLLYIRFHGTPGTRVAFYRDPAGPREFEVPVTVGVRPGYLYRVRISNIPGRPGVTLYPTVEVRGSLHLPPRQHAADHPAPFVLTDADLEHVEEGAFLTKVVYLENPERAAAVATRPDQPLETTLPANRDLIDAARDFGRPMLVVRLGARPAEADELQRSAIPGTILFPAEKSLMPPRLPPTVPWACLSVYDPTLGPRPPEEECLHDGGDVGRPAGIGPDGKVGGLDPSDTVAEYTDSQGRRRLAKSNRVCLCVPRFAVLRSELPLAGLEARRGTEDARNATAMALAGLRLPSLEANKSETPQAVRMRLRPGGTAAETGVGRFVRVQVLDAFLVYDGPANLINTKQVQQLTEQQRTKLAKQIRFALSFSHTEGPAGVEQKKTTAVAGRVEGLKAFEVALDTREVSCICGEAPQVLVDKPMLLCKWADRDAAQVGDVVTFTLKYTNNGGQPIADVAVSDSLSGRLEYVAGSARTDRNAVFTVQENEAGSAVLRWEVSGKVLPGQSGLVSFQARVR